MIHNKYTVAEFKKNTRKILNEALINPVTITRFDDEFVISNAKDLEVFKSETIEPVKELVKKRSSLTWCRQHDMELEFCGMMHKGTK